MSSPFEVRCLLSHGHARVTGILRTMCHVITDVTAIHRLSSRTVRVLPVRQFAVHSSLNTHIRLRQAVLLNAVPAGSLAGALKLNAHSACTALASGLPTTRTPVLSSVVSFGDVCKR